MKEKNAKNEIIFANVLLCLMVVFIHVSSEPVSSLEKTSLAYAAVMFPWRLSGFVVQGFIFLSALKIFIKKETINYKNYYISRFKTIVVPYVVWVFIYYLYFYYKSYFPFNIKELAKYIFIGNLVSPFYFIVIIVQFYALMPFWQRLYKNTNPFLNIVFSLLITLAFKEFTAFKYSDRLFPTYFIFWSLGAVCGVNYEYFTNFLRKKLYKILMVFSVTAAADLFFTYKVFVFKESFIFLETLHLFYCIFAIAAVISIGMFIKENIFLKTINGITFYIYLSHCLVMFFVNEKLNTLGITSIKTRYAMRFFAVYIITISLCVIYKKIKTVYQKRCM